MNKALIVYGTRYGATRGVSEEIAKTLIQNGFDVRIVNTRKEKIRDISEYDLIIVGSGIMMNRWTRGSENFLGRFREELAKKKVAFFVCCGSAAEKLARLKPASPPPNNWLTRRMPWARYVNEDPIVRARSDYLEAKAAKYNLHPIALGLFSGLYNYNNMPWYAKTAMNADRPRIAAAYKESEPGVYDTRDWNAIRNWARELAKNVNSSFSD